jgi:hypothetical protein
MAASNGDGPMALDPSMGWPPWYGEPCHQSCWDRAVHCLRAHLLGFADEFEAPPLGASVHALGRTQVANGDAARMILYRADFVEGGSALTPRGKDHLAKIAALLPTSFSPLLIERSPCAPELDAARRLAVLNELSHCTFPVPTERIVVGPPTARGLDGEEAALIYWNFLQQTQFGAGGPGTVNGLGDGWRINGR